MKLLRLLLCALLVVVIFIAAFNIVDDRCSMALAALDEPTWEEMGQVDFEPGEHKKLERN